MGRAEGWTWLHCRAAERQRWRRRVAVGVGDCAGARRARAPRARQRAARATALRAAGGRARSATACGAWRSGSSTSRSSRWRDATRRCRREERVHEARKALKRLRALLRLVRDELGERAYARESALVRRTGKRLARARDAEVLLSDARRADRAPPEASSAPSRRAAAARALQTERERRRASWRWPTARRGAGAARRPARAARARGRLAARRSRAESKRWSRRCSASTRRAAGACAGPSAPGERAGASCTNGANASRTCATPRKCCSAATTTASARARQRRRAGKRARKRRAPRRGSSPRSRGGPTTSAKLLGEEHDLAVLAERVRAEAKATRASGAPGPAHAQGAAEADRATPQARCAGARCATAGACSAATPKSFVRRIRAASTLGVGQSTLRIVSSRVPLGSATDALSPGARPSSADGDGRFGRQLALGGRCVVRADDAPGLLDAVLVAHDPPRSRSRRGRRQPLAPSSTITAAAMRLAQARDLRLQVRLLVLGVVVLAVLLQIAPFARRLDPLGDLAPAVALEHGELGRAAPADPRRSSCSSASGTRSRASAWRGSLRSRCSAARTAARRSARSRPGTSSCADGGRAGDEQVVAQAQVLPGVVDVCLRELRPGRVVRDRVQVEEVAEVDRREERVLFAEPLRREVGERGLRGLARLVEVAGVAGAW